MKLLKALLAISLAVLPAAGQTPNDSPIHRHAERVGHGVDPNLNELKINLDEVQVGFDTVIASNEKLAKGFKSGAKEIIDAVRRYHDDPSERTRTSAFLTTSEQCAALRRGCDDLATEWEGLAEKIGEQWSSVLIEIEESERRKPKLQQLIAAEMELVSDLEGEGRALLAGSRQKDGSIDWKKKSQLMDLYEDRCDAAFGVEKLRRELAKLDRLSETQGRRAELLLEQRARAMEMRLHARSMGLDLADAANELEQQLQYGDLDVAWKSLTTVAGQAKDLSDGTKDFRSALRDILRDPDITVDPLPPGGVTTNGFTDWLESLESAEIPVAKEVR